MKLKRIDSHKGQTQVASQSKLTCAYVLSIATQWESSVHQLGLSEQAALHPYNLLTSIQLSINLFRHTPWHIYDFWCSIHSITNPIYSYSFITNKPLKKTSERLQIIQILWLFSQSFKQKPVSHKI